jgi:hypothetical protein
MSSIFDKLMAIGLVILQVVLVCGLLHALARIALGHREGYVHLIGLAVAVLVLGLWQSGDLLRGIHELVTSPAPAIPITTPAPTGAGR